MLRQTRMTSSRASAGMPDGSGSAPARVPPPEDSELLALFELRGQRIDIVHRHVLPLLVEAHDRIGRDRDLVNGRTGKAPKQDGFELLSVQHRSLLNLIHPHEHAANEHRPFTQADERSRWQAACPAFGRIPGKPIAYSDRATVVRR